MNITYIAFAAACFFFAASIAQYIIGNYQRRLEKLVRVSQDLKNHLTSIRWSADLLMQQSGQLKIAQLEFLRKIMEANEASIALLHSVLGEHESTYVEEIKYQKSPPEGGLSMVKG
ncbi:MAG: hypothetical protein WCG83_03325 [Candidatus Peregrinibacteria bacterium]